MVAKSTNQLWNMVIFKQQRVFLKRCNCAPKGSLSITIGCRHAVDCCVLAGASQFLLLSIAGNDVLDLFQCWLWWMVCCCVWYTILLPLGVVSDQLSLTKKKKKAKGG